MGFNRTVQIHIYDSVLFSTTEGPTLQPNINIIGGNQYNQYILTCSGVPKDGVNKTVVGRFNAK